MSGTQLTVDRLLEAGFVSVGCWELNSTRDLSHRIELPATSGVYAFSINGVVQYVGVASKSLRQRLGFYRKPGTTQRTNIRLNEIIRGHLGSGTKVEIVLAHPPDHEWNGLKISGAEGLEAGLIAAFNLPWNVRGVRSNQAAAPHLRASEDSTASKILEFVHLRPGLTELEIAKAIHGPAAVQQQVNQECRLLVRRGKIERRGMGGRADPFTYYPIAEVG